MFHVELSGNSARVLERVVGFEDVTTRLPYVFGYTYNNVVVFQNFDVAKRKWGFNCAAPLYFNQSQTFESIKALVWEDGKVYWCEPNYSDLDAIKLKTILDDGGSLEGQKGITPELRSLFLFHALEKENLLKIHAEAKAKEDHERMMRDIPYRLNVTLQRAGGELIRYSITGKRIIVDWRVTGGGFEYNSVLDADTWQVIEAGYCMSGDDKRHNMTSLVKTAEDYENRDLTYITRR